MERDNRRAGAAKAAGFDADSIEVAMRARVRETIERVVAEELTAVLGAQRSERTMGRQGYRHGTRTRVLTTSLGPSAFALPRARLPQATGGTTEWQSHTIRRYQRRTARVDQAIVGCYLAGANTRRIRAALRPLLRGGPLAKDAVSRLVGRLKGDFEAWRTRDLAADDLRYLFFDGWYPTIQLGKRCVRVPVLVTLGVRGTGERVVVDLQLAGAESTTAWQGVVQRLVARHVGTPALAVIDGNPGLADALRRTWPSLAIQRCTVHKLRNLEAKVPRHLQEELREDYRRMMYAESADSKYYWRAYGQRAAWRTLAGRERREASRNQRGRTC